MTLTLRPATLDDLPELGPIELDADQRYLAFDPVRFRAVAQGDVIPDDVARRAIAEGRLDVAERGGALIGWLFATRVGGELCLGQVSVRRAAGGQGVGTALLQRLLDRARAAGEPSVVLNTERDLPWTAPWYARHGFEVIPPEAWSDALREVRRAQEAAGLDWSRRLHMRLRLA